MKQMISLAVLAALFYPLYLPAQDLLLFQKHKETEYDYGIVAATDYPLLSETEKIKYGLRYIERTCSRSIHPDYRTTAEVTIDSNSYEQAWMTLPRKYVYGLNGIGQYSAAGERTSFEPYTIEQTADQIAIREDMMKGGYHPGLPEFPRITGELLKRLSEADIRVETQRNGAVTIGDERNSTTYDEGTLTVTRSWLDEYGLRNVETNGYEPYAGHEGYLLRINRHERFVQAANGPCITEVKLTYYSGYEILDYGRLLERAAGALLSVALYPNPSEGVFTVTVNLASHDRITQVKAVNLFDGAETVLDPSGQNTFPVDVSHLRPGHYVLQVFTKRSAASAHFFRN